ncbi:hypothetical protein [Thiolapillus sp.]|uniref:hypothetical protein n=1 Tax=Thiolapillus sp. TaxID=2017437 RepID=UPI003AF8C2CB
MTDTKETKSQNQTAASDEDNLPSQNGDAAQPALDEDLLGDENTIDRLLMKEDFTDLEEIPGEENASQTTTDAAPEDEFDEFADDEDLLAQEPQTTSESSASDANGKSDDFLMADFDISGDEEPADPEAAENTAAPVDETPPPPEEQATATPDASEGVSREPDTSKELTELIGRVDTLHDAIDSLQAKVASQPEELEKLTREQKKSKKALEQSLQKTALLGKAALASAILALVAIGVMVAMFFSGQSDVEQLQEKIIAVEDDLSALVVNQKTGELQQLKKDFSRLSERLAGLGTQMSALQDKTTRDMQAGAAPNDAVQQGINDNSEQIAKAK